MSQGAPLFAYAALRALAVLWMLIAGASSALALKPIEVKPDQERIEITNLGEVYEGRGDSLQIETVAGADGLTGRMSVRAAMSGTNPNWLVFALTNPTDKSIERWLTAERYTVIGSGVVWPDLDSRRIEAVTPSLGFVPERIRNDRADVFRLTLEPGQTITYVAELSSERFARIHLWRPLDYEVKARDRQLFNGIMLGITGLLAVFLTSIFAANHKIIFPAAALVAWCVLAHLCVDFGFFHKLFQLRPEDNAVYRAATESAMAASLVIFVYAFLRLGLGHGLIRMLLGVWIIAQLALVAVAVIDPRLAATFARASFVAVGGVSALFTLFLALRGQDRALSLVPTWMIFLVWIFASGVTLTGRLSGDMVVSGLVAGLVLIVVLISFTVTQFAFRTMEPLYGAAPTELQTRALAVDGAGAATWEWNARRDEVKTGGSIEMALGLAAGELSTKVEDFVRHMHTADRERFRLTLWSVQERSGGRIKTDFRLRHADNSYRWFELEAASVPSDDRRAGRCVGLIRDITEQKRAHERLLHDAVHDNLTGLPNRELFLDRLAVVTQRAKHEPQIRPTLLFIDIDKFRSANSSFGLVVGDSLLLTVARRLQRHLGPQDTLARVGGDQFAVLFVADQNPTELASLAERIRRSLRSPIKIAGQEVVLTGSIGVAIYDGDEAAPGDLLKEAEIAMFRAKRGGADRIEIFRPEMRGDRDDRLTIESDLRKALEKGEIKVLYQPIIYLPTEELAGFEALVRWEHPRQGLLNPAAFVPVAEESDLIVKLGSYVLVRAASECARWHKELPRPERPLFVSVNVSSRQLFRQDLLQEIRHILGRHIVPKGALKLEITESLVMENPEQATDVLELLRGAGAELAMDDFGTGYSSLSYLQRFPFDTIKIDRALVQSSGKGDGAGSTIVRSLVALAHELGRKVVAEGIEAGDDVAFLRSVGCEYGQGFYYGEAMPDREVLQLLKMVRKSERKMQPRGLFRAKPKTERPAAASDAAPDATAGVAAAEPAKGGENGSAPRTATAAAPKSGGEKSAGEKPVKDKAAKKAARAVAKRSLSPLKLRKGSAAPEAAKAAKTNGATAPTATRPVPPPPVAAPVSAGIARTAPPQPPIPALAAATAANALASAPPAPALAAAVAPIGPGPVLPPLPPSPPTAAKPAAPASPPPREPDLPAPPSPQLPWPAEPTGRPTITSMPPPLPPGTAVAAGPQLQAPPPSAHVNPPTGPATQPSVRPALPPEFANLPPGIAASLAKLAGKQPPKTGTG